MSDGTTGDAGRREADHCREILEHLPAEVVVLDPAGRFRLATPAAIPDPALRQWVQGKSQLEYCRQAGWSESIAEARTRAIERCIAERRAVEYEEVLVWPGRPRRYYARAFAPVLDVDGHAVEVIGYGQDISSLKRDEDVLRDELATERDAEGVLRATMQNLERRSERLVRECRYLREEIDTRGRSEVIIGDSLPMTNVISAVETVGRTEANVLITGEEGTGKELVARAIHAVSSRKDRPLIVLDCPALVDDATVRERVADRPALARRGTLLLREVWSLPAADQTTLAGMIGRTSRDAASGGDVRVLATSSRPLGDQVGSDRFLENLLYALSVFTVELAPLRKRRDDVPLLAAHFLERFARRSGRGERALTAAQIRQLTEYPWPGNVRELECVIERAAWAAGAGHLVLDLPDQRHDVDPVGEPTVVPEAEFRRKQRANTLAALRRSRWRVYGRGGAAELLGLKPTTLVSRMRKMGLQRPRG